MGDYDLSTAFTFLYSNPERYVGRNIMAKFCGKCGAKLDEKTGLCPHCHADELKKQQDMQPTASDDSNTIGQSTSTEAPLNKKEVKKVAKTTKRTSTTIRKKIKRFFLKLILFVLLLSIITAGVVFSLVYFDIYEIPFVSDIMYTYGIKNNHADTSALADDIGALEEINIGEETRTKCQVLDTIEAPKSNQTMSETDTATLFAERGFDASEVTTMYSMEGEYFSEQKIDNSSETHHPLYSILYVSPGNYYWMVYCCNGEFSAYPISYVLSSVATCEVLISENKYVTSYDSDTNCFYKIIPNNGDCIIKEVSQIDSNALDMLASGELGI